MLSKELLRPLRRSPHNVPHRIILADSVLRPRIITIDNGTPQLQRRVPDQLGEMPRLRAVARIVIVVERNLVVPRIHRSISAVVASSQVLAVWATGVDQLDVFAGKIVGGVVGGELCEFVVPCQVLGAVETAELVMSLEEPELDLVEILLWNRRC